MYFPRFAMTRRLAVLAALALGMMAAGWPLYSWWEDSREFRALTPRQHYARAVELLYPGSTSDLKAAIYHLEAIPAGAEFPRHAWTADLMLPPLRLKRDRPQDFQAAEEASFRSCMAKAKAAREAEDQKDPCLGFIDSKTGKCVIRRQCDNDLLKECEPLTDGLPLSLRRPSGTQTVMFKALQKPEP